MIFRECLLSFSPEAFVFPLANLIISRLKYAAVTWPLRLREEHRLRAFQNRVLRKILGST
jgi:hypothetical protein